MNEATPGVSSPNHPQTERPPQAATAPAAMAALPNSVEAPPAKTLLNFGREVLRLWTDRRPTQLAAALAYYGMFTFAPIIYVAVTIAGLFVNRISLASVQFRRVEELLGPEVAQFLNDMVTKVTPESTSGTLLASLISFLALLYAASGLFVQVQYALNRIWQAPPLHKDSRLAFVRQRLMSFVLVIGLGLLLLAVGLTSFTLNRLSAVFQVEQPLSLLSTLGLLGFAWLALVVIYKWVPDTPVGWRDVWLGALIAVLLIALALTLVNVFVSFSRVSSALEAAGAFAVVLIGIYYMAQIFLLGAILTRAYAVFYGSRRTERSLDG